MNDIDNDRYLAQHAALDLVSFIQVEPHRFQTERR